MTNRVRPPKLARIFVSGVIAMLPVLITVGVILWLVGLVEMIFGEVLRLLMPNEFYRRGMGVALGVIIVLVVGLLTRAIFFRQVAAWFDAQLERIPLVKTVYTAVRDLTQLFSRDSDRQIGRVVLVNWPGMPIRLVGFLTIDSFDDTPFDLRDEMVAVYLPMSYQIGGYTAFIPRQYLTPVDMSFEDAMRFVVTAGMSKPGEEAPPPLP